MGFPLCPVIANIYMEYLEEVVIGPQYPIPTPWWQRYEDDVISIEKNEQVDTLFTHLNSVDLHIKVTIEAHGNDGSISFLNVKCSPYHMYLCTQKTYPH